MSFSKSNNSKIILIILLEKHTQQSPCFSIFLVLLYLSLQAKNCFLNLTRFNELFCFCKKIDILELFLLIFIICLELDGLGWTHHTKRCLFIPYLAPLIHHFSTTSKSCGFFLPHFHHFLKLLLSHHVTIKILLITVLVHILNILNLIYIVFFYKLIQFLFLFKIELFFLFLSCSFIFQALLLLLIEFGHFCLVLNNLLCFFIECQCTMIQLF